MTLEELQQLTDEQLIEKVATEVMGWRVIPQPEGWTDLVLIEQSDGHITQHWNPLTNWNDTMKVVEQVRRNEMDFEIWISAGWSVRIMQGSSTNYDARDSHGQRAILIAALLSTQPHE